MCTCVCVCVRVRASTCFVDLNQRSINDFFFPSLLISQKAFFSTTTRISFFLFSMLKTRWPSVRRCVCRYCICEQFAWAHARGWCWVRFLDMLNPHKVHVQTKLPSNSGSSLGLEAESFSHNYLFFHQSYGISSVEWMKVIFGQPSDEYSRKHTSTTNEKKTALAWNKTKKNVHDEL